MSLSRREDSTHRCSTDLETVDLDRSGSLPIDQEHIELQCDPVFDSCFNILEMWSKTFIDNAFIQREDLLNLTIKCIQLVEQSTELPGSSKKKLVLEVLKKLIQEYDFPTNHEYLRNDLLHFIDTYLPFIIDQSVAIAKGELDIGKKMRSTRKCFGLFCS